MFKNYIKIALRNIKRNKTYSFINISGLAIGLACAILILLWVQDELSFDRFHKNADNIYFVARGEKDGLSSCTSKLLPPMIKDEFPEVVNATSFTSIPDLKVGVKSKNHMFEENISLTDQRFFEIFSFPFISGNPEKSLMSPRSVVITKKIAQKYFGSEEALGQSLTFSVFGIDFDMKVDGVIEKFPENSHLQAGIIIPTSFVGLLGINWEQWGSQSLHAYILTNREINREDMAAKITASVKRHCPNFNLDNLWYKLIPLNDIHLRAAELNDLGIIGDIKYVYIFSSIALLIIFMASINYTNLSTAGSLKRAKEIGIKKVVGANRSKLIQQFMGETFVLTLIALLIAICLVQMFLPIFNQLAGKSISIPFSNMNFLLGLLTILVSTSILSGIYPAFFLSAFQPVKTIKGKLNVGRRKFNFRKALLVLQFSLSIFMIVCTIVILRQLSFFRNTDLGLDKDCLVTVQLQGEVFGKYDVLRNELFKNQDILNIVRSEPLNVNNLTNTTSISWDGKAPKDQKFTKVLRADYDFAETYRIEILEGRFFSRDFATDKDAYVINESAAKMMEFENPLHREITLWGKKGEIIGLAKNFHFSSLHQEIEPLIIQIPPQNEANILLRSLSIRFKPGTLLSSMKHITDTWQTLFPALPFNYNFYDHTLERQYTAEKRMSAIFNYFSIFAIIIACLGLYGLTLFTIEQKTKEIGIRKVLGASITGITRLFTGDIFFLVLLANAITWPLAYFVMNKWLENFAYRIDLSLWIFALAGGVTLGIALLTVSWQVVRAAATNPVKALRYE